MNAYYWFIRIDHSYNHFCDITVSVIKKNIDEDIGHIYITVLRMTHDHIVRNTNNCIAITKKKKITELDLNDISDFKHLPGYYLLKL